MNISIPKIVKKIELKNYAAEFGETCVEVWVNPPVRLIDNLRLARQKFSAAMQRISEVVSSGQQLSEEEKPEIERAIRESEQEQLEIYAELLSQGSEETRLGVEDLKTMVEETGNTDPMFWPWLLTEIFESITGHRNSAKKG